MIFILQFITLALAIGVCSCQTLLGGQTLVNGAQTLVSGAHGPIVTGGTGIQYLLVPVGSGQAPTTQLSLSPYLSRQAYTIGAPSTTLYQAPAPTVIQAPAPRIAIQAPAPVVVPAPRQVVLAAPRPQIVSEEIQGPPQPYQFGFQSTDENGNTLSRSETADGSGTVTGSYSYLDSEVRSVTFGATYSSKSTLAGSDPCCRVRGRRRRLQS